jgi:arginyl-tRNA--protein-N-Asp/Glu arginylyltransferase
MTDGMDEHHDCYSEPLNSVRLCASGWSDCGYCKGARAQQQQRGTRTASAKAFSVLADNLTPFTYERFIERGWRRSGRALYKPDNFQSCCPAHTIRLAVNEFVPSKSQRKLKRQASNLFDCETKMNLTIKHQSTSTPRGLAKDWQDVILQSPCYKQLICWTHDSLQIILEDQSASESLADLFNGQQQCSYKLQRHKNQFVASTAVCAKIAGRRKGLERYDLAKQLRQQLLDKLSINESDMASNKKLRIDQPDKYWRISKLLREMQLLLLMAVWRIPALETKTINNRLHVLQPKIRN